MVLTSTIAMANLSSTMSRYTTTHDLPQLKKIENLEKVLHPKLTKLTLSKFMKLENKSVISLEKINVVFFKENDVVKVAIMNANK